MQQEHPSIRRSLLVFGLLMVLQTACTKKQRLGFGKSDGSHESEDIGSQANTARYTDLTSTLQENSSKPQALYSVTTTMKNILSSSHNQVEALAKLGENILDSKLSDDEKREVLVKLLENLQKSQLSEDAKIDILDELGASLVTSKLSKDTLVATFKVLLENIQKSQLSEDATSRLLNYIVYRAGEKKGSKKLAILSFFIQFIMENSFTAQAARDPFYTAMLNIYNGKGGSSYFKQGITSLMKAQRLKNNDKVAACSDLGGFILTQNHIYDNFYIDIIIQDITKLGFDEYVEFLTTVIKSIVDSPYKVHNHCYVLLKKNVDRQLKKQSLEENKQALRHIQTQLEQYHKKTSL